MCGKDDKLPLTFTGVPYIWLGRQDYHCHQGKDKHLKAKESYAGKQASLIKQDHAFVKIRRATQPSKKLDCPVKFSAKKLFLFPSFKIEKDTKRNRTETSKKLKEQLTSIKRRLQEKSITKEEKCEEFDTKNKGDKPEPSIGILKYVFRFPASDSHRNHHTGRVAGLSEKLDPRVTDYLRSVVEKGNRRVKDLQSRAAEFVEEKIFFGQMHPDLTRKRFFPTKRKIRNIITSVRLQQRFSAIDQENLKIMKDKWGDWADVHFTPRYMNKQLYLCFGIRYHDYS